MAVGLLGAPQRQGVGEPREQLDDARWDVGVELAGVLPRTHCGACRVHSNLLDPDLHCDKHREPWVLDAPAYRQASRIVSPSSFPLKFLVEDPYNIVDKLDDMFPKHLFRQLHNK